MNKLKYLISIVMGTIGRVLLLIIIVGVVAIALGTIGVLLEPDSALSQGDSAKVAEMKVAGIEHAMLERIELLESRVDELERTCGNVGK